MARIWDTFTGKELSGSVRELSENFPSPTLWSSCALLQRERATFNWAKKNPLRTGVFQRYLYSISFFLSGTLHSSFLLSSRGWWTKKPLPPVSPEHASSNRGGRYGPGSFKGRCTLFLSFFLELYTSLFFFYVGGGGQKKKPLPPISPEHASSKRGGRYGPESFKGTCTPFLSFFLELYTRRFFFHPGGGGQLEKPLPPISPEHTSSNRGGRYGPGSFKGICTPFLSFFLELYTRLVSFLLSSSGWWTKIPLPPISPDQPRRTLRIRILQRYIYSISFFVSFSKFTLDSCLFFFHPGRSGQKHPLPLYHQITLRPTEQDVTDQDLSKVYMEL